MDDNLLTRWLETFALGYWGALGIGLLLTLESMPVIGLFCLVSSSWWGWVR